MGRKQQWPPAVRSEGGIDFIRVQSRGRRRRCTLGPSGSEVARAEYLRLVAEMELARRSPAPPAPAGISVAEVALGYLDRCAAGVVPSQLGRVKKALGPVLELYGHTAAVDFGPLALRACRERYVASGYCRRLCNQMASCVRQMARWAVAEELLPVSVYERLRTLGPLLEGKTAAVDHPEVRPADPWHVAATLAWLPPAVADMVRLQLLTGCRPGEVCLVRPCDVVRPWRTFDGVAVWLYRVPRHKTRWRGGKRSVALGPAARRILLPYLDRDPEADRFCPAEVAARWARERGRSARVREARAPGPRYATASYDRCVARACKRAGVPHWSPNRLRHAAGTRVGAESGREDAQALLGHENPTTTAIYVERLERAGRVAARDG